MKVAQLIALLSQCKPDDAVFFEYKDGIYVISNAEVVSVRNDKGQVMLSNSPLKKI